MWKTTLLLAAWFWVEGNGAAIAPASVITDHDKVKSVDSLSTIAISDILGAPVRRNANEADIETFTKNAAARTNRENALLQQLAFRRNLFLAPRGVNRSNDFASEVANNDLLNAVLHPSVVGHGTNDVLPFAASRHFANGGDREQLLAELIEQNQRQQMEIRRLVQQNMIRLGHPVMPFLDVNQMGPRMPEQNDRLLSMMARATSADESAVLDVIEQVRRGTARSDRVPNVSVPAPADAAHAFNNRMGAPSRFVHSDLFSDGVTDMFGRPFKLRDSVPSAEDHASSLTSNSTTETTSIDAFPQLMEN